MMAKRYDNFETLNKAKSYITLFMYIVYSADMYIKNTFIFYILSETIEIRKSI